MKSLIRISIALLSAAGAAGAAAAEEGKAGSSASGSAEITLTIPERLSVTPAERRAGDGGSARLFCVQSRQGFRMLNVSKQAEGQGQPAVRLYRASAGHCSKKGDAVLVTKAGSPRRPADDGAVVLLFEPL